ncbi:hypothetical protein RRG08_031408 [Elysia crispata]|uniref:Uncharacterized protein n=1 Tax=Elysia crispata TaxID=231223 RepID=A0AAE0ZMX1_9GAST|nr:hypothetical protein RRG08_031408 [Elysia crispata]
MYKESESKESRNTSQIGLETHPTKRERFDFRTEDPRSASYHTIARSLAPEMKFHQADCSKVLNLDVPKGLTPTDSLSRVPGTYGHD